jgi:hypothetical protein
VEAGGGKHAPTVQFRFGQEGLGNHGLVLYVDDYISNITEARRLQRKGHCLHLREAEEIVFGFLSILEFQQSIL